MSSRKNLFGMTLIEMMLALTLSLFIMGLLFEIYLFAENSRVAQTALITLQENAQLISRIFRKQIQSSTYFACAKLTDEFPFINNSPYMLDSKNRIGKYQDVERKTGTDGIRFWQASTQNAVLAKTMRGFSDLYVSTSITIKVDDDVMVSDCQSAEIFHVKQVVKIDNNTQKIVTSKPLNKLYGIHSEINMIEIKSYFIAPTERVDKNNQRIYALYIKNNHDAKAELAEGITQMKIYFSTIEGNKLAEYSIDELVNATQVKGLSFVFDLTSVSINALQKKWYVYVALS